MIEPERIESYIAAGGYGPCTGGPRDDPAAVVDAVIPQRPARARRRRVSHGVQVGDGRQEPGAHKYVVCNADEGDPGAFMDRSVLESDPHRVLEGMAIAAYAVGAEPGLHLRPWRIPAGHQPAADRESGRPAARAAGHRDLRFAVQLPVDLRIGAGAFVCGEETALMASIEGRRGTPRPRPPFPAESGLWGNPTLINNVETFANVPAIIRNGPEWFAAIGTEKSKGTKVFALAGKIATPG